MTDFELIYNRYAQDVYRFALYLCGDPMLSDDIVSESFIRLWAADEPVRMQTVKAYLFAIVRHLCIDRHRAGKRRVEIGPEVPGPGLSPEMQAYYRSELRAVLQLMQTLPEVDRAALLMRAQHDMPYEEIARVLDISLAAVKVKIHRARLKLAAARDHGSQGKRSFGGTL